MSTRIPSELQLWRAGATQALLDALSRLYSEDNPIIEGSEGYKNKEMAIKRAHREDRDDLLLRYLRTYSPEDTHLLNYPN